MAIVLVAAAYLFLSLNEQGWESNRVLAIGIGGGLGWFMMLNVWGIVWRMQKKIIRWNERGRREECRHAIRSCEGGSAELSGLASELLGVISHAVLYGRRQSLHPL